MQNIMFEHAVRAQKKERAQMEKEAVLISGCLIGLCCRYDGEQKRNKNIAALMEKYYLIPVCPEQLGGLKTPRNPSEIREGRVISSDGTDVTAEYRRGAEEALKLALFFGCKKAILKERSPSCGFGKIYDGSFSGRLIDGNGVAAALLAANGIEIYGEGGIESLI